MTSFHGAEATAWGASACWPSVGQGRGYTPRAGARLESFNAALNRASSSPLKLGELPWLTAWDSNKVCPDLASRTQVQQTHIDQIAATDALAVAQAETGRRVLNECRSVFSTFPASLLEPDDVAAKLPKQVLQPKFDYSLRTRSPPLQNGRVWQNRQKIQGVGRSMVPQTYH